MAVIGRDITDIVNGNAKDIAEIYLKENNNLMKQEIIRVLGSFNKVDSISYLIENNIANVEEMQEAFNSASQNTECFDVIKYLCEKGIDINIYGASAIRWCIARNDMNMLKYLIGYGIYITEDAYWAIATAALKGYETAQYAYDQMVDIGDNKILLDPTALKKFLSQKNQVFDDFIEIYDAILSPNEDNKIPMESMKLLVKNMLDNYFIALGVILQKAYRVKNKELYDLIYDMHTGNKILSYEEMNPLKSSN